MLLNSIAKHLSFKKTSLLHEFEQTPLGFIDVGARGGVHELVEPFAMYTAVLAFEPDKKECLRLQAIEEVTAPWASFTLEASALSDERGSAELVLMSAPTNHSLRAPNLQLTDRYQMEKWREIGREPLQVDTLDNIIQRNKSQVNPVAEFIKLDTQGSEHEILTGATETIREQTVAIVCEVSFAELYKGQKLFSEVEQQMRSLGFSFYGFTSMFSRSQKQLNKLTNGTKERPFYTDAIFFKDPLSSLSNSEHQSERQSKSLFVISLLLGYFDFALELAKATWLINACSTEINAIATLVDELSKLDAQAEQAALNDLVSNIQATPEKIHLHIGAFVDARRANNDFHDVLNTLATPQPK
ncbi:FkbM family methyltransferase [Thalassotalea euphylliae]|uniref:FkbM family methyltransferase n=1 Tax=Thalassotalea euphylliae TaxID=1655234 RepID=A0A3E0UFC7_9GAMM|nr:FkbM family methyltransferase [Thalassotalea euphylliae]REL34835.1 FkbM family methyltransferase [Thalassotalea euphylliae]